MSSRRTARERVMQSLYALEVGGGEVKLYLDHVIRPDLEDDANNLRFAEKLLLRSIDMIEQADEIIGRHTQNWELERLALIDRVLLRIAVCRSEDHTSELQSRGQPLCRPLLEQNKAE